MLQAAPYTMIPSEPVTPIVYRPEAGADELPCWLALPARMASDTPPIVAVHGIRRNARQQAELLAERASASGRAVIAPLFDRGRWPRYQQAVRRGRADLALIALMEALRRQGIWRTQRFELSGFSGGAQFAHRFAMLHPHLVARLTVASAGWYTFPDAAPFPYGLSVRPGRPDPWSAVGENNIKRFLAIPIQVCVGADDTLRDHSTRTGPAIDAQQGEHRLVRAIRWTRALKASARLRDMTPRATFVALSACGHDFRQCVLRGDLDRIIVPDGDQQTERSRSEPHCASDCDTGKRASAAQARFPGTPS